MMTAIMKKHLGKKKGFTLIEVVVVLVILAILAAIAVPALIGYISDARDRAAITEGRTVLVGLQHLASTNTVDNTEATAPGEGGYFNDGALTDKGVAQINTLTGLDLGINSITGIAFGGTDDTQVSAFTYDADGRTVTYANGNFSVE